MFQLKDAAPFLNIMLFNCVSWYYLPLLRSEITISIILTLIITYQNNIDTYLDKYTFFNLIKNKLNITFLSLSSIITYNISQQIESEYQDKGILGYFYIFISAHYYVGFFIRLVNLLAIIFYSYISSENDYIEKIYAISIVTLRLITRGLREGRTIEFDMSRMVFTLSNRNIIRTTITSEKLNELAPLTSKGINPDFRQNCYNHDKCSICLEEITIKHLGRILPCKHIFHALCVDEWILNSSPCCPVCKVRL